MSAIYSVSGKLLDACVLAIVCENDTYGYDLTQKISDTIDTSESALYPVLRRLSKDGYLTTYSQEYEGRNRKYYSATLEGKTQLKFLQDQWELYQSNIRSILYKKKQEIKEEVS